ncbi:MAG: hypothetical protein AMS22_11350 [Thiotrichales bacterium SG8_50]|nr:MAG: hypothetical protein AMS22_11350 [Thiotrichales bacterium SG8_50]
MQKAHFFQRNLVLLVAMMIPVSALPAGNSAPVYLQANDIAYDQVSGVSTYRGKVRLSVFGLLIVADKATVRQRNNVIARVNADGKPIVLIKAATSEMAGISIRGDRLEFDTINNTVIITGNVITTRGQDTIRSARLTYRIDDNHIIADRDTAAAPVLADLWPRPTESSTRQPGNRPKP